MKEKTNNLKGKYDANLDKIDPNKVCLEKLEEANVSIDLLSKEDKKKLGIELEDKKN